MGAIWFLKPLLVVLVYVPLHEVEEQIVFIGDGLRGEIAADEVLVIVQSQIIVRANEMRAPGILSVECSVTKWAVDRHDIVYDGG